MVDPVLPPRTHSSNGHEDLRHAAFTYPAIDNHAHALLRHEHRDHLDFEGVISEAQGNALTRDAVHTLACYRATRQLTQLLDLPGDASWDDVKAKRSELEYFTLCKLCLDPTGIQCILIDDGLNPRSQVLDIPWHDQLTSSPSRRIVRVEAIAEGLLEKIHHEKYDPNIPSAFWSAFEHMFTQTLIALASDPQVVAFKSIVSYRTGLAVTANKPSLLDIVRPDYLTLFSQIYTTEGRARVQYKPLNDLIVHITLEIAADYNKPVQFHTGLGDNDQLLALSSPTHLQPLIKAYSRTIFILLHASYPYTREAGYLTAVYSNVFLDFSLVSPLVSGQGQRSVIRQILELCPTNKIMWSTDAHFWPESYYLATIQSREAYHDVLLEHVLASDLTETQAISILENIFFHTANRVYNLGLNPKVYGIK